ncbi:accessory Sec system protein Asp2 [Staphylococcus sp. Marseille-Q1834]|uniref:accessory Sec system protein Asp2 n=1 Tax=Staphylococcus sp. Marseille-Q1834 TaxID=2866594 RepID=UPI0012BA217C|nr:accessory Sec system protein Asp2 [Staphylococcus sp. Marseille-Q1834]
MARKFRILQVGGKDLEPLFDNKKNVEWDYLDDTLFQFESGYIEAVQEIIDAYGDFDLVFVQSPYSQPLMKLLQLVSTPHNTVIDYHVWTSEFENETLVRTKMIKKIEYKTEEELHNKLLAVTFPGQYGDRISPIKAIVKPHFQGEYWYEGNTALVIEGDFGQSFKPLVTWTQHLVNDQEKVNEIWPEYEIDGNVEIEYTLRITPNGSIDFPNQTLRFEHQDLKEPIQLPRLPYQANVSVSLKAKGAGKIKLGAIHKRWSRLEMGQFIMGGKRFADAHRKEFIYYFNPGDMKPPLNVYFSGYRSAEGFEGYFMMNKMDAPFILIGDPRLEGGAFYLGSDTFEKGIIDVIRNAIEFLNFKPNDLILSGLSMGSFGALYYATELEPAAVVVGKPLLNVGSIADNMKLLRPNEFGTANDVLLANEGSISQADIDQLNTRFWEKIKNSNLSKTTFAIAYMQHDDYDATAFQALSPVLSQHRAHVMSRGVPGRHNDDTPTITNWFVNFYNIILKDQFGRDSDVNAK